MGARAILAVENVVRETIGRLGSGFSDGAGTRGLNDVDGVVLVG
jgi:hypothetical protein